MPTTKTRLYTIEQLAETLGITQTGPELVSLFRHLHREHDLGHRRINLVLHYDQPETREALKECHRTCSNGHQQRRHGIFDPDSSLLSSDLETPAERVARLKATHNLVGYVDMRQMAGHNGRWSDHVLGGMLRRLGCEPFEPKAKPLLFKKEDARKAIDALNQSADQQNARRNTKPKPRKSHTELLAQTCIKSQLVMMSHIAHRAGLEGEVYRICNRLSAKLSKVGFKASKKMGNNNLYRPDKADAALKLAGYELVNPWPEWIN